MCIRDRKIKTRKGAPTPDDLDELLTKVWKEPSFFLAHPRAIAAFGRECTRRGVPPPTVTLFGTPFLTWRGVPLIPSDKIAIRGKDHTTKILLLRVGEKKQGVVGQMCIRDRASTVRPVGATIRRWRSDYIRGCTAQLIPCVEFYCQL